MSCHWSVPPERVCSPALKTFLFFYCLFALHFLWTACYFTWPICLWMVSFFGVNFCDCYVFYILHACQVHNWGRFSSFVSSCNCFLCHTNVNLMRLYLSMLMTISWAAGVLFRESLLLSVYWSVSSSNFRVFSSYVKVLSVFWVEFCTGQETGVWFCSSTCGYPVFFSICFRGSLFFSARFHHHCQNLGERRVWEYFWILFH